MAPLTHSTPETWTLRPKDEEQAGRSFLEPQHVEFHDKASGVHFLWSSRRHRKGLEPQPIGDHAGYSHRRAHRYRLIGFDFGDISWWVAMLFLVGSLFWCTQGIIVFNFPNWTTTYASNLAAAISFLGGFTFAVGGYLSWVESLNVAPAVTFGAELREEEQTFVHWAEGERYRGLGQKRRHLGRHATLPAASKGDEKGGSSETLTSDRPRWRWYGSNRADWHRVGYIANTIQLFGAEVFFISELVGLPGILPEAGESGSNGLDSRTIGLWDGLYWAPQIIGSPAFIISGLMFCAEEQHKWWKPELLSMGWHVGFWNALGGFGFLFCGIFGLWRETVSERFQLYGTSLSTYWGSWAFLLGSYLQYLETLNKR